MQEMAAPPDTGFVVDWQLSDDAQDELDLSTAESEVLLTADPATERSFGVPA